MTYPEDPNALFDAAQKTILAKEDETKIPVNPDDFHANTHLEKLLVDALMKIREEIRQRALMNDKPNTAIFNGIEQYPEDNLTVWETLTLCPSGYTIDNNKYILGMLTDITQKPTHHHLIVACCTKKILEYHAQIRGLLEQCLGTRLILNGGGYYDEDTNKTSGESQAYGACNHEKIVEDTLGRLTRIRWNEQYVQAQNHTPVIINNLNQLPPEELDAEIIKRLTPFFEWILGKWITLPVMELPDGTVPVLNLAKKNTYEPGTNMLNILRNAQLIPPGNITTEPQIRFTGTIPDQFEDMLHRTLLIDLALMKGDNPESVQKIHLAVKHLEKMGLMTDKMRETVNRALPFPLKDKIAKEDCYQTETPDKANLTPELEKQLNIQKERFHNPQHMEMHQHIPWTAVEKALRAYPDILRRLAKMEAEGCEPDVVDKNTDEFIFGDCAKEMPKQFETNCYDIQALENAQKNNKHLDNDLCAQIVAKNMEADLMELEHYEIIIRALEIDTFHFLKTPDLLRHFGEGNAIAPFRNLINFYDEPYSRCLMGVRLAIRLPKAK